MTKRAVERYVRREIVRRVAAHATAEWDEEDRLMIEGDPTAKDNIRGVIKTDGISLK